ncbi:MAG TPA: MBL fold metallo-hydrolase [Polyangiaceae bacterium]
MFRTTFLGHQSWLLGAGDTQLLIDPLLEAGAGELERYWVHIHPPRRFDFDALAPVHAVVLSHEHPDHFHVPSLLRLDREIPIVLSSLSSDAARDFLRSEGFVVVALEPGSCLRFGELELFGLQPDGRTAAHELDVVPLVVRDAGGHGSFFSSVDLSLTPAMAREALVHAPRPGVWTVPNNDLDMSAFCEWLEPIADQSALRAADWARDLERCLGPHRPEIVLVYGGGFAFTGSLESLNRRIFNCDSARAAAVLAERLPGLRCHAVEPGETVVMKDGRVAAVEGPRGFVTTPPRGEWPLRSASNAPAPLPRPSTGRERLSDEERRALPALLDRLGEYLSAAPELAALDALPKAARDPVFCLWLREDDGASAFVLDRRRAAFRKETVPSDPRERYLLGVECWASDLVAVLELECSPDYVVLGHMKFWNFEPRRARVELDMLFYLYGHPLRQPDRYRRLYAAQGARPVPAEERVRGPLSRA